MLVALGMIAVHVLGFSSSGFKAWHSPPMVVIFYMANGLTLLIVGFFVALVVGWPLLGLGRAIWSAIKGVGAGVRWLRTAGPNDFKMLIGRTAPWGAGFLIAGIAFFGTGGFRAIWFWGTVWVRLGIALFITALFAPFMALAVRIVMGLVVGVLRTVGAKLPRPEAVRHWLEALAALAIGINIYALLDGVFPIMEGVRLPVADPMWGSLLVLAAAAVAAIGVSGPIVRYRNRYLPGRSIRRHESETVVPEPKGEFWSPAPIIGWRVWQWDGITLRGVMQPWLSPAFVATCEMCVEVPGWSHTCGVYAVMDRHDIQFVGALSAIEVVGRVELSGLVIEHDTGYRAEKARIVELFATSKEMVDALAARYPGVEVHMSDERSMH